MENISKNKRGRPKLYKESEINILAHGGGIEVQTKRTLNNEIYFYKGLLLFKDSNDFRHLIDHEIGKINRKTIMVALGRVAENYDDQTAIEFAKIICQEKLNTAQAIDFIKRYRMGDGEKLNKNKVEGVLKKIINLINNSNLTEDEVKQLIILLHVLRIDQ